MWRLFLWGVPNRGVCSVCSHKLRLVLHRSFPPIGGVEASGGRIPNGSRRRQQLTKGEGADKRTDGRTVIWAHGARERTLDGEKTKSETLEEKASFGWPNERRNFCSRLTHRANRLCFVRASRSSRRRRRRKIRGNLHFLCGQNFCCCCLTLLVELLPASLASPAATIHFQARNSIVHLVPALDNNPHIWIQWAPISHLLLPPLTNSLFEYVTIFVTII